MLDIELQDPHFQEAVEVVPTILLEMEKTRTAATVQSVKAIYTHMQREPGPVWTSRDATDAVEVKNFRLKRAFGRTRASKRDYGAGFRSAKSLATCVGVRCHEAGFFWR